MTSSTRIPHFATSAINDSPIEPTAALLERYAPRNGTGASTDDDVTLQIRAAPARSAGSRTRHRDEPKTLVSKIARAGRHDFQRKVVASTPAVDEHA
jgi:hypothetical protein